MRRITIAVVGLLLAGRSAGWGQAAPGTAPVAKPAGAPASTEASVYVDENPTVPAVLKMRELTGKVRDLGGMPIPRATVSLFTEEGHALITTVVSDRNGEFRFGKIDKGLYRVVARVEGLCPANVPVKLESSLLAHRKLEITMQPKDIGTCSYGMGK